MILFMDMESETQLYLGLYERETYSHIEKAAGNFDWVIDIGAGKGELSLYFAMKSGAEKIIAVEPQDADVEIMHRNMELNGLNESQRINILKKRIGTGHGPEFVAMDLLDIDERKRGFIKIDVDGYEMDVLASGEHLFSNGYPTLLLETHSAEFERGSLKWLGEKGYHCTIIKNAWWRIAIPEYRFIPHNRWLWATKDI
jgi:hypothetical protein